MRSKHIAAIITFFAAFIFSTFIALLFAAPRVYEVPPVVSSPIQTYEHRCKSRLSLKIKDFLSQDKRNGYERRRFSYSDEEMTSTSMLAERADSISEYSNKSGSMDAGNFPLDFQKAWKEHMAAWSKYADFMQSAKNRRMNFEDLDHREGVYIDDINSTWQEVLDTGRKYGADLPAGF